jgi:REP element-mobilizing transposase RayT
MARPLRIEYPNAFYHVINRGNAGENIFLNERDKEKFLKYLGSAAERFSLIIHTYCLMTNHYHLVVETPEANLSRAIQWLNVSYATYFNRKRDRKGHLFQGRFKSIVIDADEYLAQLSRYIHLNPVRVKMVVNPTDYPWSSYPLFIGKGEKPDWLDTSLLAYFGTKKKAAIRAYQHFVEEVDPFQLVNPGKDLMAGCILGNMNFVSWLQKNYLDKEKADNEIPQLKALKSSVSLERIITEVCTATQCTPEQIRTKGGKRNQAREMAIYLARDLTGLSCRELGGYFGNISGAAITMRCKQLSNTLSEDKNLQHLLSRIKKAILNF